jgi:hypothetical protein
MSKFHMVPHINMDGNIVLRQVNILIGIKMRVQLLYIQKLLPSLHLPREVKWANTVSTNRVPLRTKKKLSNKVQKPA